MATTFLRREVLRRAAAILGSKSELRARLRVSMHQLDAWLSGTQRPPVDVFLTAVDIIGEAEDAAIEQKLGRARGLRAKTAELSRAAEEARSRSGELREQARSTIERSRKLLDLLAAAPPAVRRPFILAPDFGATEFPPHEVHPLLEAALNASMNETGAARGYVQLGSQQLLRIVEQIGFGAPFLEFFARVTPETTSSCAEALRRCCCVVVEDVRADPMLADTPAAGVMVEAGALACQSTPFLGNDGGVIGMLSTHFEEPHQPSPRDLQAVEEICRHASQRLEHALA